MKAPSTETADELVDVLRKHGVAGDLRRPHGSEVEVVSPDDVPIAETMRATVHGVELWLLLPTRRTRSRSIAARRPCSSIAPTWRRRPARALLPRRPDSPRQASTCPLRPLVRGTQVPGRGCRYREIRPCRAASALADGAVRLPAPCKRAPPRRYLGRRHDASAPRRLRAFRKAEEPREGRLT